MQQQDPLADAQIRTARYWNVDGLSEIAVGLQVLLVPLSLYGVARTPRASLGRLLAVLVLAIGLPAAMLLSRRALIAVRSRFTYRRTGFIAYQPAGRSWAFGVPLALALLILLLVLRAASANWVAYLFAIQGLVPGALTIYYGRLVRLMRFQVLGALTAALGIAIAIAQPDLTQGMEMFWTAMSAMYLLSGALVFWRYVRRHPDVAEAS
jgi:hypothetical protein